MKNFFFILYRRNNLLLIYKHSHYHYHVYFPKFAGSSALNTASLITYVYYKSWQHFFLYLQVMHLILVHSCTALVLCKMGNEHLYTKQTISLSYNIIHLLHTLYSLPFTKGERRNALLNLFSLHPNSSYYTPKQIRLLSFTSTESYVYLKFSIPVKLSEIPLDHFSIFYFEWVCISKSLCSCLMY